MKFQHRIEGLINSTKGSLKLTECLGALSLYAANLPCGCS
jgi:hypothetical protein